MTVKKINPFVVLQLDDGSEWIGRIPEPVERYMAGMAEEIKRLRAVLVEVPDKAQP